MSKLLLVAILLFSFFSFSLQAQNDGGIVIKGNVRDGLKLPLPGVSVVVKGTSQGTITNMDGEYSLSIPKDGITLQFSFIGFEMKEVVVQGQRVVDITLLEDTKELDEVVVVGYGQVRKRDLTGSVASVKPSESEASKVVSVDNLLQGKLAGVAITGNATPGAAVSIQIRGANSLRGDNQPLYVIDNIPMASTAEQGSTSVGDFEIAQNPLTSLNPQDIESIEVLKDASATAIYGSRGANGVILVTTKKGRSGKASVSANANFTLANATRLKDMLGMSEFADYRIEQNNSQYVKAGSEYRFVESGVAYDENDPDTYHLLQERNWQEEITRMALSQNYGVSITGGSEKSKYFLSASYKNIEGLVKETGMQQGDIRLNLNNDLTNKLKLNFSVSSSIKQNNFMSGGDTKGGPSGSIVRESIDGAPHLRVEQPKQAEDVGTVFSWINDYSDITNDKTFRGSAELRWNISKVFSYSLRSGGNLRVGDRSRWFGVTLFRGLNDNGYLAVANTNAYNYTVENLIDFNKKLSGDITLNGVLGVTYDDYRFLNKSTIGKDFESYSYKTNGMHMAKSVMIETPVQQDYQLASYLGRTNISIKNGRYLATVSLRADGSSKFKKEKWGYFPSASLAWRVEEESFLTSVEWLDQMKLRLGWGMTGNQGIAPYATLAGYAKKIFYAKPDGSQQITWIVDRYANENLKWETTESYNVGLDFGFVKSRINGTIDLYAKKTRDLLINQKIANSVGFKEMYVNRGSLSNKGFEASLTGVIIASKDLKWEVTGNFAVNRSSIEDLGLAPSTFGSLKDVVAYTGNTLGDRFGVGNIFIEGRAPGLFYGYKTDGIIQRDDEVTGTTYKVGLAKAGEVKFVDVNGDKVIDGNDLTVIGDPNAKFNYGFQTALNYKKFSFSAAFYGVYGNQILNANRAYEFAPTLNGPNINREAYQNAWRGEGTSNLYPSVTSKRLDFVTDRLVEDGSFLRCSDITLGYKLPQQLIRKAGLQKVDLFVSAKNLFILTDYSGYDPEVSSFAFDAGRIGIDMNSFPNPRQFIFGLNLTF